MKYLAIIKDALLRERYLGKKPPKRRRRRRQRGIALVMVMIAIAITLVITNEFGTTTNVDMMAAANYRDQMRSHFLARSSLDLSELVIRLQQRLDNIKEYRGQVQITDFADQVLLAFCGSPEEVQAAVGFSAGSVKGLGADVGQCGINGSIKTEDDKINVNCANGNDATAAALKSELDALIFFPAYDPIFDEPDAENYRRDRATQVASIVDYIDSNQTRLRERGTTEDYGYESLKDRYYAKNNYIDTVGELKLARGVDDRFWTLFGSSFTVYGSCKTNLSALSNSQLIAAILYLAAKNPNDPILANPQQLFQLAGMIAQARQFGETFSSLDDFISYVKDPGASISSLASKGGSFAGSAASSALSQGIPALAGGTKLGIVLDKTKLAQIAGAGPRRTYRVEAWGEIERAQKDANDQPVFPSIRTTITGVWDTKVVPQNARKPPVPNGAWVFMKEE
jgi:general secretion pathway protein K